MTLFLSNCRKELALALKKKIFSERTYFQSPLIIVPCQELKKELMRIWIESGLAVVAGIEMQQLPTSLELLFPFFPSKEQFTLILYDILLTHLDTDLRLQGLKNYVQQSNASLLLLSEELSRLIRKALLWGNASKREQDVQNKQWLKALWEYLPTSQWVQIAPSWREKEVYIFGFSHFPSFLLEHLQPQIQGVYLFSPSLMFWGDFHTKKEKVKLYRHLNARQREEWESFSNEHPLLSSYGKLGRDFFNHLDERDFLIHERFIDPGDQTLLSRLKQSILMLRSKTEEKKNADESLQIFQASSRLQEVSALLEEVKKLIFEKKIAPREILILAPNIELYIPWIHQLFSIFPYSIKSKSHLSLNGLNGGITYLFEVLKKRWDRDSVLKLFSHPLFRKKWKWGEEEIKKIENWMNQASIFWGVDVKQRSLFLKEAAYEKLPEEGTWALGIQRLIKGLAFCYQEELPHFPLSIDLTDACLLGEFYQLLLDLSEDLKLCIDGSLRKIAFWLDWFAQIAEKYFDVPENEKGSLRLLQKLASFAEKFKDHPLDFSSAFLFLQKLLAPAPYSFCTHFLHGLRFASFSEAIGVGATAICILGLNEEEFPKKEVHSSFLPLSSLNVPLKEEVDRYLFLENLLSAGSFFKIFYSSAAPSLCVAELNAYLKEEAAGFETIAVSSMGKEHLVAAAPRFFAPPSPAFSKVLNFQKEVKVLPLNQLKKLARHPVQFYLNHGLNVFIPPLEQKSPYLFSSIKKVHLRNQALRHGLDQAWEAFDQRGELPVGKFKDALRKKIEKELSEIESSLNNLQTSSKELFSIELRSGIDTPQAISSSLWIFPSLKVTLFSGQILEITGLLSHLSPQGYLFWQEGKMEDWLRVWPELCLFLSLQREFGFSRFQVLNIDKRMTIANELPHDPKELLIRYLHYLSWAEQSPSPLMPAWGESLLKNGSEKELRKAMNFRPFPDPYLEWIEHQDPSFPFSYLFSRDYLRSIFEGSHALF
jgi:exodeoxyribonuclease V gamma subunit